MWTFVTFPRTSGSHVQNHALTPGCVSGRLKYIKDRYDEVPETQRDVEVISLDVGGMCRVDEPSIVVPLPDSGCVRLTRFQISSWIYALEAPRAERIDGCSYVRVQSWPGMLVFMTIRDRSYLLDALHMQRDVTCEIQHDVAMHNALVEADAAMQR